MYARMYVLVTSQVITERYMDLTHKVHFGYQVVPRVRTHCLPCIPGVMSHVAFYHYVYIGYTGTNRGLSMLS